MINGTHHIVKIPIFTLRMDSNSVVQTHTRLAFY